MSEAGSSSDSSSSSAGLGSSFNSIKNAADLEFDMHAQLEELGVLMGAITSDVISPKAVPLNTVRVYSDRLKAWHANLPSSLTLSTAVRESQFFESPRSHSTLLIHCAYLGSITQLTRRILVERVTAQLTGSSGDVRGGGKGGGRALTEANATAEEFSKICVSAARQLATVKHPPFFASISLPLAAGDPFPNEKKNGLISTSLTPDDDMDADDHFSLALGRWNAPHRK